MNIEQLVDSIVSELESKSSVVIPSADYNRVSRKLKNWALSNKLELVAVPSAYNKVTLSTQVIESAILVDEAEDTEDIESTDVPEWILNKTIPDESWTNEELDKYAEYWGVEVSGNEYDKIEQLLNWLIQE